MKQPDSFFRPRRHPGRAAATLLLSALLLLPLTGCLGEGDYRPDAIGQEGVITVVIDSTEWQGPVGDALRATVGQYVNTLPAPERMFDLKQVNLRTEQDLEAVRKMKNVLFVAPLDDTTNVARYIKNVFDAEAQEAIRAGQRAVIGREDLWRRDQQVYYITGANEQDVIASILERGETIVDAFNEITRERLQVEMFERGRQPEIETQLMEEHGFALNVQHDYLVAMDTTNFVWLRRILSDTWRSLFIYYEENADPSQLTPEWIYSTRDSLTRMYVQGNLGGWVEIHRIRPLETENIDFLGRYGFETRGLWQMVGEQEGEVFQFGMGGPFVTYTFYDEASDRIYMIDGMVFAPGFDKREFLRQMEVIAHTFRTRAEATAEPPLAAR